MPNPRKPPLIQGVQSIPHHVCTTLPELAQAVAQLELALGVGPSPGSPVPGKKPYEVEPTYTARICLESDYTNGVAIGVKVDEHDNDLDLPRIDVPDPTRRRYSIGKVNIAPNGGGSIVNWDNIGGIPPVFPSWIMMEAGEPPLLVPNADLILANGTIWPIQARNGNTQLLLYDQSVSASAASYTIKERIGAYEGAGNGTCGAVNLNQDGEIAETEKGEQGIPGKEGATGPVGPQGDAGPPGSGGDLVAGPGIMIVPDPNPEVTTSTIKTDNDFISFLGYTDHPASPPADDAENAILWKEMPGYVFGGDVQFLSHINNGSGMPLWVDKEEESTTDEPHGIGLTKTLITAARVSVLDLELGFGDVTLYAVVLVNNVYWIKPTTIVFRAYNMVELSIAVNKFVQWKVIGNLRIIDAEGCV
jgi:hypothetical protein